MIGFLKSRSLKNAAARKAAAAAGAQTPGAAAPQPSTPASPTTDGAPPADAGGGAPAGVPASAGETAALENAIEAAATTAPPAAPERYEPRENTDGWFVYDRETEDVAETYGYRLARMNRARAESLVEVLNRGEARRKGRNG